VQWFTRYWLERYDWRTAEAELNGYEQYLTDVEGEQVHLLHVRSPEPDATPLVLLHGWPGSVVEFLDVVGPLSDPAAHGGDASDAFHVVVPSMPGYGFSGPTRRAGVDANRVADVVAEIMTRLGYDRFIAQGGDWGAVVARRLGEAYADRLLGLHVTMLFSVPAADDPTGMDGVTDADLVRLAAGASRVEDGLGYLAIQSTQPDTLAFALNDSPVGLLAWILEKFNRWTDIGDGTLTDVVAPDRLLTNIMLYWLTGTAGSAARLYCESERAGTSAVSTWTGRVEVPTGHVNYPGELLQAPRAWGERGYNLVYWSEPSRGGHFAAMEQPALFTDDLRAFARLVR